MSRKKKINKSLVSFIVSVLILGLTTISMGRFGFVGITLNNLVRFLFGEAPYIYEVIIIVLTIAYIFNRKIFKQSWNVYLSAIFILVSFILIMGIIADYQGSGMSVITEFLSNSNRIFSSKEAYAYSGFIGAILYGSFTFLLAKEGLMIFILLLLVISVALIISPKQIKAFKKQFESRKKLKAKRKKELRAKKEEKLARKKYNKQKSEPITVESEPVEIEPKKSIFLTSDSDDSTVSMEDAIKKQTVSNKKPAQIQADLKGDGYILPSLDLLDDVQSSNKSRSINQKTAETKGEKLIEVLDQFGIQATLGKIHIGPAVTKFEINPDSTIKINKISSIQDNLMMELAVKTLRIEAPIPGKRAVGIEIPNVEMIPVRIKELIKSQDDFGSSKSIDVVLGRNLMGKSIVASLNEMPHLLVAGATGSGKSVCINSMIVSLLLTKTPEELKMVLIDPKKVEFTPFQNIPHLYSPVISDPKEASMALNVLVELMEERYEYFSEVGAKNLHSYNNYVEENQDEVLEPLPWIVVVIDELADLMAVAGKDVEQSIQRITQLARAAGIHLILATQRPSVDVVTGIIKANIPSRIAFAVSSAVDSRTILDTSGAEKLLGYGDMLYMPMSDPVPTRIQGAFVSDSEVKRITQFVSKNKKPKYHDDFVNIDAKEDVGPSSAVDRALKDEMYEVALEFVVSHGKASTSRLQRHLAIGYNRAADFIEAFEDQGIIGPAQGSKPRDVYLKESDLDKDNLNTEK